jgi:crotonobetainyl-CoA:carnitine CoA-transferase CaiB-like acyl-CoA transferase
MSGIDERHRDKRTGRPVSGAPMLDHISGLFAFMRHTVALYDREKTGEGNILT